MKPLKDWSVDWRAARLAFLDTFLWGMVAHAYCFLNLTISHDSLYEFISTYWQHLWKNSLGRIFVQPYHELFRGIVAIPWLVGLLSLVWIALTVYLIIRMFSVQNKTTIFFIAGVLVVNLSVICNAATYVGDLDANMLALLTAAAAAYLWQRHPRGFWLGIPLIAVSLGLFQSYVSVTVVLIELACILRLLDRKSCGEVVLAGLKGVAMLLLGGALYLLCIQIGGAIFGFVLTDGTPHSISNLWTQPIMAKLGLFFDAYADWFAAFAKPFSILPATYVLIANCVLLGITAWLLASRAVKGRMRPAELALLLALLALIPFSANLCYVLNGGTPGASSQYALLTQYAFWLVYLLPLLLAEGNELTGAEARQVQRTRALRTASFAMLAIFLWANVVTANTAYIKKDLERQAALSSMSRALSDLNEREEYVRSETPVAFYGFNTEFRPLEGFEEFERGNFNGLAMNSQITCDYHWAYIRYILNEDIVLCSTEQYQQIEAASPEFKEMPSFPDKGYIRLIDGVMVVKMGP